VQTEMQDELEHAAQITEEYQALRQEFVELQDAHEHVQKQLEEALQQTATAQQSERAITEKLSAESKRLKADIDHAQGLAAAFMEVGMLTH
jgi:seryl-tRNA synthetase